MKNLFKLSNIIFSASIIISLYGFYKIYRIKQNIFYGSCPIEDNRPILYSGIFLMILSIIVSYIEDLKIKKRIKD